MLNSNLKIEFDLHENELVGREWFGAMAAFDTGKKTSRKFAYLLF